MKDGRVLFWEVDRLRVRLPEFAAESPLEVLGLEEDMFVHLRLRLVKQYMEKRQISLEGAHT